MTLRSSVAAAAIAAAIVVLTCGCADRPVPPGPVIGTSYRPAVVCSAEAKTPQMLSTSAIVLSPATWERRERWEAQLRFRIDETGAPTAIRATVRSTADDEALEQATADALSRYRFCRPVAYAPGVEWSARVRFSPLRVDDEFGGGEMLVQLFLPSYTRDEVRDRRAGDVEVHATFEQEGRPTTLRVTKSSGDAVLDRKSIEAMASYQLVFRPGTVLTRPLVFSQKYTYEIR